MKTQHQVCAQHGSAFVACDESKKIGIAIASMQIEPIYGTRYAPMEGTEGWFIWGGENTGHADFFQALHVTHIKTMFPQIEKYLSLAPGYSFIIDAGGYEDVWFTPAQSQQHSAEHGGVFTRVDVV